MFDDLNLLAEMTGDAADDSFCQPAQLSRRVVDQLDLIRPDSAALELRWFRARLIHAYDTVNHGFRVLDDVQCSPSRLDEHGVHAEQIGGDKDAEVFDDVIGWFVQHFGRCTDDIEKLFIGIVPDGGVDSPIEIGRMKQVVPAPFMRAAFNIVLELGENYAVHRSNVISQFPVVAAAPHSDGDAALTVWRTAPEAPVARSRIQ